MSHELRDVFYQTLPIKITLPVAKAIIQLVNTYETRDSNPLAFNTYSLGVHKCLFLTSDRNDFFNLFDLDYADVSKPVHDLLKGTNRFCNISESDVNRMDTSEIKQVNVSDISRTMSQTHSADTNFRIVTDPFNIFAVYIIHLCDKANIPNRVKEEAKFKTFMFLQYRFFTSLVNHRFPYGADESMMTAMFESLTGRFDIKSYGTWKKVMEARAVSLLNPNGIHGKTIQNFAEDRNLVYFLSDSQTRIRNQINLITGEYMKIKDENDAFGTYSATGTNEEGEKVLLDNVSMLDVMCSGVYGDSLSVAKFLDQKAVSLISNMFSNLNSTNLRSFLVNFSDKAVRDNKAKTSNATRDKDGRVMLVGAEIVIKTTIQRSYRYCVQNNIDIRKPILVLKAMKDAFSASRVMDEGILQLRESVGELVLELQSSRRDSVMSALRIGFMLYILILSFKYSK